MKKAQALEIIGGLSKPSKMPCASFSLSALDCKTGGKLRESSCSVCRNCYAMKGNYQWPNVLAAHRRRLTQLQRALASDNAREEYIEAFVTLLKREAYFRFFDSGDLQSIDHLDLIFDIAERLPNCQFWLPTKEAKFVRQAKRPQPDNLVIRVSAPNVDQAPLKFRHTSTVHKNSEPVGTVCDASKRGNKCGPCRACWDSAVSNISYPLH